VPFVNTSEATKSVEKPNRERLKSRRLVNNFTCTDHDPADVIGLDKNNAMPLANLKTITDDVTLTLPHAFEILSPCIKIHSQTRLYNAAASSPSRPREGDSLAITVPRGLN